jgi:diacylglycerol kinase family enzyme
MPSIPVIVNTTSGTGHSPEDLEAIAGELREAGIEARIVEAKSGEEIGDLAREELKGPAPVVVAAGGDGTVSAVADAVRGTDTALGVLPLGTRNHFAKDLGIPVDRREAIRVIAEGHRKAVDVGEVNGHVFINNSSLGLYPDLVRDREKRSHRLRHGRRAAMIWTVLAGMRRTPLLGVTLRAEGEERRCRSPFVFLGNNEYEMQGFQIGTRARLDGGFLSIYTTTRSRFAALFGLALRALFKRLDQAADFSILRARQVRVESRQPRLLVATDGEIRMLETPLDYTIVPRSLNVLVPARTE